MDTVVSIDTPERVRFRYRLAGPGLRAGALMLDWVVQAFFLTVVAVASITVATAAGEAGAGTLLVGWFVITWFYAAVWELVLSGRTPGKVVLRLRVVRLDGAPVRWSDVVLRNLLRAVDGAPFPYGLGALVALLDPRARRIGDLVAGTMVVIEQANELAAPMFVEPMTAAEREGMPARVELSRAQRRAIEAVLRRVTTLGEAKATELARPLAVMLQERRGLPAHEPLRTLELAWLLAGPR